VKKLIILILITACEAPAYLPYRCFDGELYYNRGGGAYEKLNRKCLKELEGDE